MSKHVTEETLMWFQILPLYLLWWPSLGFLSNARHQHPFFQTLAHGLTRDAQNGKREIERHLKRGLGMHSGRAPVRNSLVQSHQVPWLHLMIQITLKERKSSLLKLICDAHLSILYPITSFLSSQSSTKLIIIILIVNFM